ncbi:MAG: electron transfer flavoprotein subunit alpha/FixB family protein [Deltaproteobacteria bacterium]|nr:MAG: electron transfer flavoprotein subunit alpha/FixB family protein [Deltaproteobacteria bacterium]
MQNPIILVIAEHFEGKLKPVTLELLTCAEKIRQFQKSSIIVTVLGDNVQALAERLAKDHGVNVIAVHNPHLQYYNGEIYKTILTKLVGELQPVFVCVAHTAQGLDFAPAMALRSAAACITGVEGIFQEGGHLCFSRLIFGGKVVTHVVPSTNATILTVQPGLFKPHSKGQASPGKVEMRDMPLQPKQTRSMGIKTVQTPSGSLAEAKIVVTAGRGIGKKENLDLIYRLAEIFPKAAVGGSRPVCDMGWLEYRQQVGVTGATVNPELYLACGVSGAVQHLSGMRGAGFVVAINTDPNAAIFNLADVCVTEDLTTFIPALIEAYKKKRQASD